MVKNHTEQSDGTWELPGLGAFDKDEIIFKSKYSKEIYRENMKMKMFYAVLQCSDDPQEAPENGFRNWPANSKYAGSRAMYTCKSGYLYVWYNPIAWTPFETSFILYIASLIQPKP